MSDCGVASMQMIIEYYKGKVGLEYLRNITKTNKNGTTAYHIIEALKELGFESHGVKTEIDKLNKENLILPCIAHVTINQSYKHYIVIYEVDYKKKKMTIADPAQKLKVITFEEFRNIWNNILIIMYPNKPIAKYENDFTFKLVVKDILNKNSDLVTNILLLCFLSTFLSIGFSFYFKTMIDKLTFINSKNLIIVIFIFFLIIYILKNITELFRNKILIYLNQKIDLTLIKETFKNIILLPYQFYASRTSGDIISRINDISSIRDYINKFIVMLGIDIPLILGSLIILYFLNMKLFLIVALMIIIYIILFMVVNNLTEDYVIKTQTTKATLTSSMIENINNYTTIKGINIEEETNRSFNKKLVDLLNSVFKYENYTNVIYSIKEFIYNLGLLFLSLMGCLLIIKNEISLSSLIAYQGVITYLLDSVKNVVDFGMAKKEGTSSIKRMIELFYSKKDTGIINKKMKGKIVINNLTYSHDDITNIINESNITINAKDKVLIMGPSGNGKSTLLKILMRYYKVDRNMCFIDEIDINDFLETSIKNNICFVSQKENLFTDSLLNNLKLNRNISNEDILEVTGLCNLDTIIDRNDLGYQMLIEENGFNLSGGERQRIVLARALLRDFNILILDEALNEVDIELESNIMNNIIKKYNDKTIIVVSHRKNNLELFNRILEMKEGKICDYA